MTDQTMASHGTRLGAVFLPQLPPERLRRSGGSAGLERPPRRRDRSAAGSAAQLREQVTALRALLAGEQVTTTGRYVQLDRVALDWPPAGPVQVLAGAGGPKSLALCGEVADGTILSGGTSPDGVRQARASLQEGRRLGDRRDPHPVVVYVLAATGPGAEQRVDAERRSWGYADGDTAIAGPAEVVADAVRRWADAGADTIVLQPTADDPDPEGFVRFVAEQGRPLVPWRPRPRGTGSTSLLGSFGRSPLS